MYIFCFFDLPTFTKKDRKIYTIFRKKLLNLGFDMLQFSVYIKSVRGTQQLNTAVNQVKLIVPKNGNVSLLIVTDRQYHNMISIYGENYMDNKKDKSYKIIGRQGILEF